MTEAVDRHAMNASEERSRRTHPCVDVDGLRRTGAEEHLVQPSARETALHAHLDGLSVDLEGRDQEDLGRGDSGGASSVDRPPLVFEVGPQAADANDERLTIGGLHGPDLVDLSTGDPLGGDHAGAGRLLDGFVDDP